MSTTYPHDKITDRPISDTHKENKEEKNGVTYIGRTFTQDAQDDDPNWQIQRHYIRNGIERKDYAKKAQFLCKWTDREELFEKLDFSNENSIHLDGINERITLGASHPMDRPKTISVWIKPRRITSGTILAKGHENGYLIDEHFIDIQNGKIRVCLAKTPEKVRHVETEEACIKRDTWHHVVVTCDPTVPGKIFVHIDGEDKKMIQKRDDLGDERIQEVGDCLLGSKINADYLYGNIDELLVYDKALTPDEIKSLHNDGTPGTPIQDGLLHWYRLGDHDIFPEVRDEVGSANGICQNMEKDAISKETP